MRDFNRYLMLSAFALAVAGSASAQDATEAPEPGPAEEAAPVEAAPTEEAAPVEQAPPVEEAVQVEQVPPADAPPAEETPVQGEDECALGQICLGPVVTGGLFNVIGLGVHARYEEMWGFGIDYQFLPISAGDVDLTLWLLTIDGRIYPFGGAFFGSLGFSYQGASFDATTTSATIGIPQIKIGLGFMGRDGFVMGIDLALGIPLGSSDVDFSGPALTAEQVAQQQDIEDAADIFVNALPMTFQLNLIRIGYLF
jgi:hypothetical protein